MGIELKPKWTIQRRTANGDLFAMTRNKLTLQYSGMLILFLSLFIIGVYALLYGVIWSEQRSALGAIADSEFQALKQWSDQGGDSTRPPPRDIEDAFSISNDQSFYYLIGDGGHVQLGGEIQSQLREQVMQAISQGQFVRDDYTRMAMQIFSGSSVVAVSSWSTGPAKRNCGLLSQGILVAPQRGWIDATLAQWGETARWAGGR